MSVTSTATPLSSTTSSSNLAGMGLSSLVTTGRTDGTGYALAEEPVLRAWWVPCPIPAKPGRLRSVSSRSSGAIVVSAVLKHDHQHHQGQSRRGGAAERDPFALSGLGRPVGHDQPGAQERPSARWVRPVARQIVASGAVDPSGPIARPQPVGVPTAETETRMPKAYRTQEERNGGRSSGGRYATHFGRNTMMRTNNKQPRTSAACVQHSALGIAPAGRMMIVPPSVTEQ